MLLPPAVKAFYGELETEVERLCGMRYSRGSDAKRWATQGGSIVLGNQQVAVKKDFKNVYSDVRFLADLGLIELREEGPHKTLVPVARFSRIELPLAA